MWKSKLVLSGLIVTGLLLGATLLHDYGFSRPARAESESSETAAESQMIYELRTYTTVPGRLPALHARFQNHTMALFEKHGMKNVIYWTPSDKPDTLVYVLAHASEEAARRSFAAFREDPEWKKARDESERDGPIVQKVDSQFLVPTPYSPIPTLP